MKKHQLLLCLLLSICTLVSAQRNWSISNPEAQYYSSAYSIKKIEITPEYTIVDMRVSYLPNYWFQIDSITTLFKESNGDRTFKLIKSEGYELNKHVFMPESGYKDARFYFEPIPADVKEVDLIEGSAVTSYCFNIQLRPTKKSKLDHFLGNWITKDGSNEWVIGLTANKVLYKNDFWSYSKISGGTNSCTIKIAKDSLEETIYLKKQKNGNLLFKASKNAKAVECSKEYTFIPQETDWTFNQKNYEKEIFKGGKAVIRGYLEHYTPKLKETIALFNIYTHEADKEEKGLAEINEDGTFELEIDLNYPIAMYVKFPSSEIYVRPNDTLLVYFDLEDYNKSQRLWGRYDDKPIFMGSKVSADINNFSDHVRDDIFKLLKYPAIKKRRDNIEKSKDPVKIIFAYRDEIVEQIDQIIKESPQLLKSFQVDDYVKDQMVLNNAAELFIDLIELYSNHEDTKVTHTQKKDGTWERKENKAYKAIDSKEYHNFVSKYNKNILDNILNISSSNTWVIFNRYEYTDLQPYRWELLQKINAKKFTEIVKNILETEEYKHTPDSITTILMNGAKRGYFIADSVTAKNSLYKKVTTELLTLFSENNINLSAKDFYHYSDSITTTFGASNNFLYQMSILREFNNDLNGLRKEEEKDFVDRLTEDITHALPLITNDYLRKQLLQMYRQAIKKCESNVEEKVVTNPKAEAVYNKIIAPYKGNVIYMDFWGLGCGPCRAGMISAKPLVEELKSHKIKFLYVSSIADSPEAGTNKFLKDKNIKGENIRVTSDEWSYLAQKFGISGIPHCVLIDKDGKVVENKTHHLDKKKLLELEKK